MLVSLAKLGSVKMVGLFILGMAVAHPVFQFASLQLRIVLCTDPRDQCDFSPYLRLSLLGILTAICVCLGVGFVYFDSLEVIAVIGATCIALACQSLGELFYGLLQKHERLDRIARAQILKGIVGLAAFSATVYATSSVSWALVALGAARGLLVVLHDIPSAVKLLRGSKPQGVDSSPGVSRSGNRPMRDLVWLGLPLGLTVMLLSLRGSIPRLLVEHHLGEEALGVFGSLAFVLIAGATVINALGQSAMPRLAKHHAEMDFEAFRRLLFTLVMIGAALGGAGVLVTAVAGKWILTLLYTPQYAEFNLLFVLIAAAVGIEYIASFLGYAMSATRCFNIQPVLQVITCIAALGAAVVFIPSHGIYGAAYALMCGNAVALVSRIAVVSSLLSVDSSAATSSVQG